MAGKKGMKWKKVEEPRDVKKDIRFTKSEYEDNILDGLKKSGKKNETEYMRDKILGEN